MHMRELDPDILPMYVIALSLCWLLTKLGRAQQPGRSFVGSCDTWWCRNWRNCRMSGRLWRRSMAPAKLGGCQQRPPSEREMVVLMLAALRISSADPSRRFSWSCGESILLMGRFNSRMMLTSSRGGREFRWLDSSNSGISMQAGCPAATASFSLVE